MTNKQIKSAESRNVRLRTLHAKLSAECRIPLDSHEGEHIARMADTMQYVIARSETVIAIAKRDLAGRS